MKRAFLILLAAVSVTSAQTFLTVTADTNRVIRTNFSLVRSQISDLAGASFAISNITGLQTALDGKLATNGSALGLSNFPGSVLLTNSSLESFPQGLLRTNGDGSGLTNLPNANLTNATGVLPLSNGGTGQTNAALAIEALLPAYTNNEGKVLALDTNLSLTWTTNAGGGSSFTNSEGAMYGLFFASTNDNRISMFSNGGTNEGNRHTVIGSGASGYGTNFSDEAVVIGAVAEVNNGGVAIGSTTVADQGVALGPNATSEGRGAAIGNNAIAGGGAITGTNHGSVAIGSFATATNQSISIGAVSESEAGGIAIGRGAISEKDTNNLGATAVGFDALAEGRGVALGANAVASGEATVAIGPNANATLYSIAIGDGAKVSALIGPPVSSIQLGSGTNTTDNTIQIWNAGTVTTNQWSALANATTIGTNLMRATNTTSAQLAIGLTNPATYPAFTNNAGKVLAVTTNEAGVEWLPVSNTVTDASLLTNFPASILQTNSSDGSFPAFLLRTNGNGAGLTNLTAANIVGTVALASNVSGTVAVTNGGTGASDVTNARINLLPSYTGNSNRVLALNSNATEIVWAVDGGGVANLTNVTGVLGITNGGTGTNTAAGARLSLGIVNSLGNPTIGGTASGDGLALGRGSSAEGVTFNGGVAIGYTATAGIAAVAIGQQASSPGDSSSAVAVGQLASASNSSVAIGDRSKSTNNSVAIGKFAHALGVGIAQIGTGTNTNASTIQFLTAGSVDTNKWSALANAGTVGTNLLLSTNIAGAQAAIFTNTTTNAPTNTNAPTPDAWLDIRVGTNDYKLPLWQ